MLVGVVKWAECLAAFRKVQASLTRKIEEMEYLLTCEGDKHVFHLRKLMNIDCCKQEKNQVTMVWMNHCVKHINNEVRKEVTYEMATKEKYIQKKE